LNGVVGLTATTAGADARTTDLRLLVAALQTNNAGARPAFICAPGQAVVMADKCGPKFNYPVFASNALAAGTIVCVDVSGLVFAYDTTAAGAPEFEISNQSALHEEDTTPLALNTGGVTASPIRSLWQTTCNPDSCRRFLPAIGRKEYGRVCTPSDHGS
jgi:hypothetical protein